MRALGTMVLLGLAACAGPGPGTGNGGVSVAVDDAAPSTPFAQQQGSGETSPGDPFAGAWQSCDGASSPEECSRYLLAQRGDRICGTWSYLASGKAYDGRVVAHATSPTEARRTQVCGRPGAETDTECSDGWQSIDKPLLLCDGKLGDLVGADGACFADYQAARTLQGEWEALQMEPWVQDCLSDAPSWMTHREMNHDKPESSD
ncbi:hypothetical protein E2F46_09680 [Luteimonas aestuarii]|uniref:Lipoprotein n=1 Tax=Luteimonas aestuarii TaxID=453837 RepID=A0A4R5TSD4_9GAMM|nr:hypothetical protein [Luteimonas aestuarii]TDK23792.1 hypothetical protein E2F46_09680 [Luteimonas aestuarii]